jgi:hypothetical protein
VSELVASVHCESEVNDETGGGSEGRERRGRNKKRRRAGVGVIDSGLIVACVCTAAMPVARGLAG